MVSLMLTLWQWVVARRFPLHRRSRARTFCPPVSLLKPLKGCDEATEGCLRSWFAQEYAGSVQILFGVASATDPVCDVVRRLQKEFPLSDSELVVCGALAGENAKVSKLAQLDVLSKHDVVIVSDADVRVTPDFIASVVAPLKNPKVGLVNCFYRLANPTTPAMRWEGIAINSDFWSNVMQSLSLKPIDFALGAVMVTRRKQLDEIGGFATLVNCLADDYQLGNRIARNGSKIALSPVVVECWSDPMGWGEVWKHQLRWARTIRVCQPAPYFFSILNNATLWPLLLVAWLPSSGAFGLASLCWGVRVLTSLDLQRRMTQRWNHVLYGWLVPVKDLLQAALWLLAFTGDRIEWRGVQMRMRRDGTLARI
jgi:ceramide glucosyltransferase